MRTYIRRTATATVLAIATLAALAVPAAAEPEIPTRVCLEWEPELICVEF